MRRLTAVSILVLALFAATGAQGAVPLYTGLGSVHHAVAVKSQLAQKYFDQGLRLCYAFNHDEAIRAFREAARLDPSCAMAHWGIAYALGPNVNFPVDPAREKEAFGEVASARKLAAKTTAKERSWIEAMGKRYSDNPNADLHAQDQAYADAMRELAAKYPEDPDASVIFAEALMTVHPWDWWSRDGKPLEGTTEAIATLQRVLKKSPTHTGANHLFIHAVEESPSPGRAVISANRLATLAPNAAQLVESTEILSVFHAGAQPHIAECRQLGDDFPHAIRPLGEDLIRMPRRFCHHGPDLSDEIGRHLDMEQVGHRIDEYHARVPPPIGLAQRRRMDGDTEARTRRAWIAVMLVLLRAHRLQSGRKGQGVARVAAGRHSVAPGDRVPRDLGPLDP